MADETTIKQSIERASIQKQYLAQKEVLEELKIGNVVMSELYQNGLQFIKIVNQNLMPIEVVFWLQFLCASGFVNQIEKYLVPSHA